MTFRRHYTVQEIKELVELLRHDPDILPDKFSGMLELVQLLTHFENMTDAEIESEVRDTYRKISHYPYFILYSFHRVRMGISMVFVGIGRAKKIVAIHANN